MAEKVDNSELAAFKSKFEEKIAITRKGSAINCAYLSAKKYGSLINDVELEKSPTGNKKPRDYWLLRHYDVLVVQNKNKLIVPVGEHSTDIIYYVCDDDLFDTLHSVHISIGHDGRDRMRQEAKKKYKNITRPDIQIFLNLCKPCQQKLRGPKKGLVVKPMIYSEMNSGCQVDLIDFQSQHDGDFRFIMVYQDHLTKFVILNPLERKTAELVAMKLIDIFTLIGSPSVLQSDNGREFRNEIINNLSKWWPELKIVHGKPRHSQSQGSVEKANQDIENMLTTWMQDNKTSKWSEGLRFVQLMKNRAYHSERTICAMRELQRRFAYWPLNEALNGERLTSLERGLEKVNTSLEKVDRDLDQLSSVVNDLCLGFDELDIKITNIAKSNSKFIKEHHGNFATIHAPIQERNDMKNRQ